MRGQRSRVSSMRPSAVAGVSTRGAVNDIFRTTETLLDSFSDERKQLHQSIQDKIAELHGIREEDTHSLQVELKNYVDELQANSREWKHDTREKFRDVHEHINELRQSMIRKREELCEIREHNTHLLQEDLRSFVENLRENVSQFRADLRREIGTDEPAFHGHRGKLNGHKQPEVEVAKERVKESRPKPDEPKRGFAIAASKSAAFKAGPKKTKVAHKVTHKAAATQASSSVMRAHGGKALSHAAGHARHKD